MKIGKKSEINSDRHKEYFYELLNQCTNYSCIYTDGSKEDHRVADAMVCGRSSSQSRLPDLSSIFSAEAKAILLALDFIERSNHDKFVIFSDSLSCLQAIHGTNLKNPRIMDILEKCHFLSLANRDVDFCWLPSHVGISGNERADTAAKAALHLNISAFQSPYTDYKQTVTVFFTNIWQNHWNNITFNKLQPIKGTIGETKFKNISKRRDVIALHRSRIGHTHLTHSYLLKAEDQPQCIPCQCSFSVEHILLHCGDFAMSRQKFYNVSSLQELFNSVSPCQVLNFLKEIQLYHKF
jgi:hypothetical protein